MNPTKVTYFKEGIRRCGSAEPFSLNMSFVRDDPYVREAITSLRYGSELLDSVKGHTRSGASLAALKERIHAYKFLDVSFPKDEKWTKAVERTFAAFKVDGLRVFDIDEVEITDEKTKSHPGWTFRHTGKKKGELEVEAKNEARKYLAMTSRGKKVFFPPCMSFVRTQLGTIDKPKVRLVWGFPFEVTILEGMFCQPLLSAYSQGTSPMFMGRTLLQELPLAIDHIHHFEFAYGLDWSAFDSSINPSLIRLAFDVLKQNFRMTDVEDALWNRLIQYFIHTAIVFPDGEKFIKSCGIPSGSYFTQMVGSIINFLLISYSVEVLSNFTPKIWVLGDDSAFGLDKRIDIPVLSEFLYSRFGMTINIEKSVISTSPDTFEFLGHRSRGGKPLRDERKLLLLALFPEREVISPEHSASRIAGLLLDSGFNSNLITTIYNRYRSRGLLADGHSDRFVRYVLNRSIPIGELKQVSNIWAFN